MYILNYLFITLSDSCEIIKSLLLLKNPRVSFFVVVKFLKASLLVLIGLQCSIDSISRGNQV